MHSQCRALFNKHEDVYRNQFLKSIVLSLHLRQEHLQEWYYCDWNSTVNKTTDSKHAFYFWNEAICQSIQIRARGGMSCATLAFQSSKMERSMSQRDNYKRFVPNF